MKIQKGFQYQISIKKVERSADKVVAAIDTKAVVTENSSAHILNILYQSRNLDFQN